MKLVIRRKAVDDLDRIYDWIAEGSAVAALRVARALRRRMHEVLLPELVDIGRPGRRKGTRELIEGSYIVVYKVDRRRGVVTVLAVFHGAQER